MKTPKTEKKSSNDIVENEKTSGKKLVQARLPFKILSTPPVGVATMRNDTGKDSSETRKRKLSYEKEEIAVNQAAVKKSVRNVSESIEKKIKGNVDIVLLSDSNDECEAPCSKENVKSAMAAKPTSKMFKQKHFESDHEADMHSDDVDLMESTDEETQKAKTVTNIEPVTVASANVDNKDHKCEMKTITPKGVGKGNHKNRRSTGDSTTEQTKVLIKFPVSAKKTKRRKTSVQRLENDEEHLDSDDVELASPVSHSQKRPKLEEGKSVLKTETTDNNVKKDAGEGKSTPKRKETAKETPTTNGKQLLLNEVKSPRNTKNGPSKEVKSSNGEDLKCEVTPKTKETARATTLKNSKNNEPLKEIKSSKSNKKHGPNKESHKEVKSSNDEDIENDVGTIDIELATKTDTIEPEAVPVDLKEVASEKSPQNASQVSDEETTTESDTNKSKIQELSSSSTDAEADAETETTIKDGKLDAKAASSDKTHTTPKIANEPNSNKLDKKNLTPKQQKLMEQRLKAREEKERKIQEERLQKQREKEERELARKREREEKDEQKRKEREEKEEQRRVEREEKERKRLAELEMKNEEKRKRNEAKEEELRKKEEDRKRKEQEKEEERKRKEQEKEEAELKKKKAAMAFTKFFSRSLTEKANPNSKAGEEKQHEDVVLAFRPFQVKGDMKLAPTVRKQLTNEAYSTLDSIMEQNKSFAGKELYVEQLKAGAINPHKWRRPAQKDAEETKPTAESDDDVVVVEDELERAGLAIVEEPTAPVERLRVKFFKFHANRRPPYYGTWRKKSKSITPRRPLAQDKEFFDYDVDSDDEWEEEEPGESLDGSDDEKEKESEDEEYEYNEWFVPHGYLSDEELQCEDEMDENNDREAQKAKLQILQKEFAQEMKKKTEKIKPRLIGCIWVDENGNQPELCPKIIWDSLSTRAILCAEPPVLEEIEANSDKNSEASATNGQGNDKSSGEIKLKPITLNKDMLTQLVKLVHGNTHSKNFMIKEFIAYIEANEESVRNGEVKGPLKSAVREKIDEYAQWQVIEKTDANKDNNSSAKKKKNKKKLCWVVSAEKLQEMEIENLGLNNNWQYILQPREPKAKAKTEAPLLTLPQGEDSNEHSEASVERTGSPTNKSKPKTDIKKFTKVLTAAEKAQQLQKSKEILNTPSTKPVTVTTPSSAKPTTSSTAKTPNSTNNNNSTTPTVKKRVPLLMSVARGQSIPTTDKNARISQFLKTLNSDKQQEKVQTSKDATPPIRMDADEIVILD